MATAGLEPAEWKPSAGGLPAALRLLLPLVGPGGLLGGSLLLLRRGLLFLLLLGLVAGGLGRGRVRLDQLHQRHRRRVARSRTHLEDPRVAARAGPEARPDVLEQLHDQRVVAQRDEGATAARQRVRLAERDERLDDPAQLLRLRERGPDRLGADEGRAHVAHQRLAVAAVARELASRKLVSHVVLSRSRAQAVRSSSSRRSEAGGQPSMRMPSVSPWLSRTSLISVSDFLPRFGVRSSSTSVRCTRSPM